MIRIKALGGLYCGPLTLGNYQVLLELWYLGPKAPLVGYWTLRATSTFFAVEGNPVSDALCWQ